MFKLSLRIEMISLYGFEALDRRRALGLCDGPRFSITGNQITRSFPVLESFARAWFAPQLEGEALIDQAWLMPGELVVSDHSIQLADNLPVARAQELYIRGRTEVQIRKARVAAGDP